jgi:competence protein ComEA
MSTASPVSVRHACVSLLSACILSLFLAAPGLGAAEKDKGSEKEKSEKVQLVVIPDEAHLLIVLNKADVKTLDRLPGIGKKKAEGIVAGRPYAKVDDVVKVKGIAEKVLAKVKSAIGTVKVPESLFATEEAK